MNIFDIDAKKFSAVVSLLPKSFVLWLDTKESIELWKTFENDYRKLDNFFQIIQKNFQNQT